MRVFVTGASGFIGSAIVAELQEKGHQVIGLARSEASAQSLIRQGVQVHRGDLEDLDSLRSGAAAAEAVIHTAFNHDFSQYKVNCESDRQAIEAMGSVLIGTNYPLIITTGTGISVPGKARAEEDPSAVDSSVSPRQASEEAIEAVAAKGVNTAVIRLSPSVHDTRAQGLVTILVALARQHGQSAYLGEGLNRWPAVHRLDAASLFVKAFEKGVAGGKYHAVAEEGVTVKEIAAAIAHRFNIPLVSQTPEEAAAYFGWLAPFMSFDIPASSMLTRQRLGWNPTHPTLLEDLANLPLQAPADLPY